MNVNFIKLFLILFCALHSKSAVAVNSYYTENDYEKTSAYAGITEKENIDINDISKPEKVQDNKARKVYNTIIIRRKNGNLHQQQNQKIKEIPEVTVKPVNEVNDRLEEYNKRKKTSLNFDNFFKTTPDRFSVYALVGYSISLVNNSKVNAVHSANSALDNSFSPLSFSTVTKGSGFGFITGIKIYLNKSKFAFFLSPELFYNNLNLSNNNFSYNSAHNYKFEAGDVKEMIENIPAEVSVKTKEMYGTSLRFGFTLMNMFSFYGKASIGGMRHGISSGLNVNGVNNPAARQQWSNPDNDNYISSMSQTINKTLLFYGFGGGFEVGFLNQHIIIRLDYDHYFGSGIFSLNGDFSRIAKSERGNDISEGTKWKMKNNFGIAKLTVGLAF